MTRSKILIIFLVSVAFMFQSCNDSGVGPGPGKEEPDPEPIEPEVTIVNPQSNTTLTGTATVVIEGKSENGFDEARITIGDSLTTITDPALPIELEIETFTFANDIYDIKAELDATGQDTTVSSSVSVSFENYLLTIETSRYIKQLKSNNDAVYLFISDLNGNVLSEIELTSYTDGVIQLLPPQAIEGQAPEKFNITFGFLDNLDEGQDFDLSTVTGFKAWSRIYIEREETTSYQFTEPLHFKVEDYFEYTNGAFGIIEMSLNGTAYIPAALTPRGQNLILDFNYPTEFNNLLISHFFFPGSGVEKPIYKLVENLQEVSDTLVYDVYDDYNQMISRDVNLPFDTNFISYAYSISVDENSWDAGSYFVIPFGNNDSNSNSAVLGMYIPDFPNRLYRTQITAHPEANNNISFFNLRQGLPDEFVALEGQAQINNLTPEEITLTLSGEMALSRLRLVNNKAYFSNNNHSWRFFISEETETIHIPDIADSLNPAITQWETNGYELSSVIHRKYEINENYEDFLNNFYYSSASPDFGDYYNKYRSYLINGEIARTNRSGLSETGTRIKTIPVRNPNFNLNIKRLKNRNRLPYKR